MLLFASVTESHAQRKRQAAKTKSATATATAEPKPESVVMLPAGARQEVDTALINPQPRNVKSRRRFGVMVVPAAPPGRSRQEIMYTDSIMHRSPPR